MENVAIITGASSGLGEQFALLSPSFFHIDHLFLVARRKERLEQVAMSVKSAFPSIEVTAVALALDTETAASFVKKFVSGKIKGEAGDFAITLLVNNAGFGTYGEFSETEMERTCKMVELNCSVVAALCHAAVSFLRKGSTIINISSMAAYAPLGNFAVYAATKSFVLSFSLALRAELKDMGVNVCAVCPGPIETEFAKVASNGARQKVIGGVSPVTVAKHALVVAKKGKAVAIAKIKWRVGAFLSRFVPAAIIARYTYLFCKRPCAHEV